MTEQVFARALHDGLWQWQRCDAKGQWLSDAYQTGDSEALRASLPAATTPVNVVLSGQQVISTELQLAAEQRKHAAKIIPFELEDELASNVEALHFSFSQAEGDAFSVLYADRQYCEKPFADLVEQACEVPFAAPDYLLLQRPEQGISLCLENGIVLARLSDSAGFAIELEMAEIILRRIAEHDSETPRTILLFAENEEAIASLRSCLPESWQSAEQQAQLGDFWQSLDHQQAPSGLNLRSGSLARQLPVQRWWNIWKLPSYFMLAAFIVALVVNVGLYYSSKSKESRVLSKINEVYLDAVPDGRLGDVEGILESKLKTLGSNDTLGPTNLVYLLSKVTTAIANLENAKLTNFNYSGEQMYLQLTIEVDALATLGELRSALTEAGVTSESPRTTALGDGYQARMRVLENK